jgi:hypothetical protein
MPLFTKYETITLRDGTVLSVPEGTVVTYVDNPLVKLEQRIKDLEDSVWILERDAQWEKEARIREEMDL